MRLCELYWLLMRTNWPNIALVAVFALLPLTLLVA